MSNGYFRQKRIRRRQAGLSLSQPSLPTAKMNSALSHNLSTAISRVAPAFKVSGDEVSTRLLAILFPTPTVTMPTVPVVPATPPKPAPKAPVAPPAPAKVPILNLVGLNPTLQKKLMQFFDEANGKGSDDAYADAAESFLSHVNRMTAKDYGAKPPVDHLREFLIRPPSNAAAAPAAPPKVVVPPKPAEVEVNENCVAVMYKGREYWVGEDSKRVYEETSEGIHELRGMLGLAEFDAMVMPVDEV